jgi:di/tricarboxylate transporter
MDYESSVLYTNSMIPDHVQPFFVLGIISILLVILYKEYLRPSVGFMLAVLVLILAGILTPGELLTGFSNESIAAIIMLILITAGLKKNFRLESYFDVIFKKSKTYRGFMFRMMSQVALISAVTNNTPIVALMTPYVVDWGKKNRISPSKLLIPMCFATTMGGMMTLIGTSTTLILNGFMQEYDQEVLHFGDLLLIGASVTIAGILFMGLVGHRLLPDHRDLLGVFSDNIREFVVETRILGNSRLIGKRVTEAGLRNLKGVYLVEILRNGRVISPVEPQEVLLEQDILFFAGNTEDIIDLIQKEQGLELPTTARDLDNDKTEVVEAVLSNNSSLIGKPVKRSDFRNRYNAAIVAIHRNGERVQGKIGDIELKNGDLLLLYAGTDFYNRVEIYRDIYVVSQVREINKPGWKKYYALALMIACAGFLLLTGKFSLFPSLLIIVSIMAGFGLINTQDVKREIDPNLIVILVFSLAIGQAIIKTDAGNLVAGAFIDLLSPYGSVAILAGLMLITVVLTSFITNVAAVSIAFPLAFSICHSLGLDGTPFYLGIAYMASAAFLTPIAYQTNLIIYGPGGYNFKDFFRTGLPVTLLYFAIAISLIVLLYQKELLG